MNSRTRTIDFSAKYTIGMVRGLSTVMVFARLPPISFTLHAVHDKLIQSKPGLRKIFQLGMQVSIK